MKEHKIVIKHVLFSIGVLCAAFCISLTIEKVLKLHTTTPAIFSLAVFVISRYTEGYLYGILGSLISVLAVNFAFTFPYFKFNFIIAENLVSAIVMLSISIMTGVMTTKLKQQEQIRVETEKEKMRGNLLRAISHDLRTPLTTIYGSSSAIMENIEVLSKEQIVGLLSGMKEDAQWLIGMVENLLSVTKIENSGVKLNKTPVVLEELVDSVMVKFRKRYPEQVVQIKIPEEFISIPMDAVLITQVIVNMLENAIEHAEGMTTLMLQVKTQDQRAIFQIIDDGCGMSKERMNKVFQGYFESKNLPVDNKKNDMGIGLSVCASIIKAHEGEISVHNLKEGGCCFQFILKMEEEKDE